MFTTDLLKVVDLLMFVLVSLWPLATGLSAVLPCSLSYCLVKWILSGIVRTFLGKRELTALLFCALWLVYFLGLFALLLVSLVG